MSWAWRIFLQLLREFAIPFAVALAWAIYVDGGVTTFITNFSWMLFGAWWFLGQIFRVIRQQAQDEKSAAIATALTRIQTSLTEIARHLIESPPRTEGELRVAISETAKQVAEVAQANNALIAMRSQPLGSPGFYAGESFLDVDHLGGKDPGDRSR